LLVIPSEARDLLFGSRASEASLIICVHQALRRTDLCKRGKSRSLVASLLGMTIER